MLRKSRAVLCKDNHEACDGDILFELLFLWTLSIVLIFVPAYIRILDGLLPETESPIDAVNPHLPAPEVHDRAGTISGSLSSA
jgi:hypothetical protein